MKHKSSDFPEAVGLLNPQFGECFDVVGGGRWGGKLDRKMENWVMCGYSVVDVGYKAVHFH